MIRTSTCLIVLCLPAVSAAQTTGWTGPMFQQPNIQPGAVNISPPSGRDSLTPAMRRQKLAEADALRQEAYLLEAADGGTLTDEHVAYIKKRVARIKGL